MEFFSTAWHVLSAYIIFIFGGWLLFFTRNYFSVNVRRLALIYAWHTVLCAFYAWYVINNGGDALMYYQTSLADGLAFSVGTAGVRYITYFFSVFLGLSFLGCFLVFNVFGTLGLVAFDAALRHAVFGKPLFLKRLATLIILLPSISFWSSAVGKDAISFMATGFALWAALDISRRKWLMIFAILSMLLVRPHMAAMMIIGLSAAFVLQARLPLIQRILFGGISIAAAAAMVPFALDYAGVGAGADMDALLEYTEERQGYNQQGGGGVDISSMSFPMQLFTYLFRPLPIEAGSIFQLAASLDNMILLFLFIVGGLALFKGRKARIQSGRVFLWVYALLALVVLAMTTANLGISVRQKWMFTPVLIYLLISVMGRTCKRTSHDSESVALADINLKK
ncbi:hypothetical protein SAMN05216198_1955 [Halopseudomonas litoralis]|uniref:EpsG family protein n=1 Tax=Halopseudomonas litoralis TaxID=797277 RepID=A0A1H1S7W5_9GAMM|nr:hypothetical protein [Halopseudomonas litoralis]SDS44065.1 hypothetical protein SAMN05216198_1955 [Halopseudomonas litoralis]